ncbi:MAG: hypothetical protein AAFV36_06980 [Myxococcota bacterium]
MRHILLAVVLAVFGCDQDTEESETGTHQDSSEDDHSGQQGSDEQIGSNDEDDEENEGEPEDRPPFEPVFQTVVDATRSPGTLFSVVTSNALVTASEGELFVVPLDAPADDPSYLVPTVDTELDILSMGADLDWIAVIGAIGTSRHLRIYRRLATGLEIEETRELPPEPARSGQQVPDVAVWDDTILVGSPSDAMDGRSSGAVLVYALGDAGWYLQTTIRASDGAEDNQFGTSVVFTPTGYAVVGAPFWGLSSEDGALYSYQRTDSGWGEIDQITGSAEQRLGSALAVGDGFIVASALGDASRGGPGVSSSATALSYVDGRFGAAPSLKIEGSTKSEFEVSASGDFAVVAERSEEKAIPQIYRWDSVNSEWSSDGELSQVDVSTVATNGETVFVSTSGSILRFERDSSDVWEFVFEASGVGLVGDARVGRAMSADGGRLLIGVSSEPGYAEVYSLRNGVWTSESRLQPRNPTNGFGAAVSLQDDRALVGSPTEGDGVAYIFELKGGEWEYVQRLAPETLLHSPESRTVLLDGDTAWVAAKWSDWFAESAGAIFVYERSGSGEWLHAETIGSLGTQTDAFGSSLAVCDDQLFVGVPYDDGAGNNHGAVRTFVRDSDAWVEGDRIVGNRGGFGEHIRCCGDRLWVGGVYAGSLEEPFYWEPARVYGYRRDASGAWKLEETLLVRSAEDFEQDVSTTACQSGWVGAASAAGYLRVEPLSNLGVWKDDPFPAFRVRSVAGPAFLEFDDAWAFVGYPIVGSSGEATAGGSVYAFPLEH